MLTGDTVELVLLGGPRHGTTVRRSRENPGRVLQVPVLPDLTSALGGLRWEPMQILEYTLERIPIVVDGRMSMRLCYRLACYDPLTWCSDDDRHSADALLRQFSGMCLPSRDPVQRLEFVWFLPHGVLPSLLVLGGYQVLRGDYPAVMFAKMDSVYVASRFVPERLVGRM